MRQTATSQTQRALLVLRQFILDGRIEPSRRLTELRASEITGVSRTPVRAALQSLAAEGLVRELPSGGYEVQTFSEREVADAVEVRGALEGLAARFAAERGIAPETLARLREIVQHIDRVLSKRMDEAAFEAYGRLNADFHTTFANACGAPVVMQSIGRAIALPFASPSAFVSMQAVLPEARRLLHVANDQHRCVIDAIEAREGARAEALMREHARLALRNLKLGLTHRDALLAIPGGGLIREQQDQIKTKRRRDTAQ